MKPHLISVHTLLDKQVAELAALFTVHDLPFDAAKKPVTAPWAGEVRFLQTSGAVGGNREFLASLPKLEIVGCYGVGVDSVDVAHCKERGIPVTNTPDVLNDEVADLAIALMLMTARQLGLSERWVRDGRWVSKGNQALATRMSGKKLGLLGFGRIGKVIARRAAAFDMDVSYHTRNRQDVPQRHYADLAQMARDVDFLVAIVPGGPATKGLVSAAVLDALGPEGMFINVARGTVADEPALVRALVEKRIAGAGLDVFVDEPNVPKELLGLDNVVLLPHVGSSTVETRGAMADLTVANLTAHLAGKPLLTRVA